MVGVHRSQCEVRVAFRTNRRKKGDSRLYHLRIVGVHDPSFPPAPAVVVLDVDPGLININVDLALEEFVREGLCALLSQDQASGRVSPVGNALDGSIAQPEILLHHSAGKLPRDHQLVLLLDRLHDIIGLIDRSI